MYDSPIATHNPYSSYPLPNNPGAASAVSVNEGGGEPSAPSYAPPGVPESLHPSGPAYDARQGLPSQVGSPGGGGGAYKAYAPPSSAY